jgi:hypothetical protein
MSYSLELRFRPAIRRERILQYFAGRRHFTTDGDNLVYRHPDTSAYFFVRLRSGRNMLLQRAVATAEFEVNYFRPSFFGVEAEKELAAFVVAFRPRIDDPQMYGMGSGPYSRDAFLKAWNFGNVFSTHDVLSSAPDCDLPSLPEDVLRAVWEWNYLRPERSETFENSAFVPGIRLFRIDGRPRRVVVWGQGMPILLPQVDHVLVGREVSGEPHFGLVPWSDVLEVLRHTRFDTTKDPITLHYFKTPQPIAEWVANVPSIDVKTLERLRPDQVLDDELIAAARSFERDHVAKSDGA